MPTHNYVLRFALIQEINMSREKLLSRISVDLNIGLGQPYIQGHRIWVSLILDLLASGKTIEDEEILEEYPSIERDDILACIAYGAEMVEKAVELQQLEVNKHNGVVYADCSEMANDQEDQEEALAISKEFERADWEALQLGEYEYETR